MNIKQIRKELYKQKEKGFKVYVFGTRLMLYNEEKNLKIPNIPEVTKHLTDKEFAGIIDLINGVAEERPIYTYISGEIIKRKDLQTEAKGWIKRLKKEEKETLDIIDAFDSKGIINFIKLFFDLK